MSLATSGKRSVCSGMLSVQTTAGLLMAVSCSGGVGFVGAIVFSVPGLQFVAGVLSLRRVERRFVLQQIL